MRKTILYSIFAAALFYFSQSPSPAAGSKKISNAGFVSLNAAEKNVSMLTRANFEDVVGNMYETIGLATYGLGYDVFRHAMVGYYSLAKEGALNNTGLLTIIDFGKPSTAKRFYTIDVINKKVKYHTHVAHGRNTGENLASKFSNTPHSNQSSLGFYVTGEQGIQSQARWQRKEFQRQDPEQGSSHSRSGLRYGIMDQALWQVRKEPGMSSFTTAPQPRNHRYDQRQDCDLYLLSR